MDSKWISNNESRKRVKQLLQQAGIPLELQISSVCKKFCQNHAINNNLHLTSAKCVYSPKPDEEVYREVDEKLMIYQELEVSELIGVQLIMEIPIECKYRENIEIFGFPSVHFTDIYKGFPIHGDLAGSVYFRSLRNSYSSLSNLRPHNITLLEIKDNQTPSKVSDEQLFYKAGGSLYDFVLFDMYDMKDYDDSLVKEFFDAFETYLRKNHYVWWSVIREWTSKQIDIDKCEKYNSSHFSGRLYHGFKAYFPVVCVNAPLYSCSVTSNLKVRSFKEVSLLTTSIRKSGWPGMAEIELLSRTPEVPIVITNPDGLDVVLETGFKWYENIRGILTAAPAAVLKRAPLESAFFKKVFAFNRERDQEQLGYRSDLDFRDWI